MMCGGTGAEADATEEVQLLCNELKTQVEAQTGKTYAVFKAITFKSQCVSGTNYFVKVCVGGDDHLHLRIYKKLSCNGGGIELSCLKGAKRFSDPVEFF